MIDVRPCSLAEANEVVAAWHSHHRPVRGHKFSLVADAIDDAEAPHVRVGVVIVGRPVAQALDDGRTYEVTRLCTNGYRNAASFLLGAAWRAAKAMGIRRMVSYTRADEDGTSYKAAGWRRVADVAGREWCTGNKADRWLPGLYEPTTEVVDRVRWEVAA
jgi:hypothetical protein